MTEQSPHVQREPGAEGETPPGMPRWVKVSAIVVAVLLALFLVLRLTGIGGEHGPGRHMSGSAPLSESATVGWLQITNTAE